MTERQKARMIELMKEYCKYHHKDGSFFAGYQAAYDEFVPPLVEVRGALEAVERYCEVGNENKATKALARIQEVLGE